jgi:hypothetical protein
MGVRILVLRLKRDAISKPHFGLGEPIDSIAFYDVAAAISGPAHEPRFSASYWPRVIDFDDGRERELDFVDTGGAGSVNGLSPAALDVWQTIFKVDQTAINNEKTRYPPRRLPVLLSLWNCYICADEAIRIGRELLGCDGSAPGGSCALSALARLLRYRHMWHMSRRSPISEY